MRPGAYQRCPVFLFRGWGLTAGFSGFVKPSFDGGFTPTDELSELDWRGQVTSVAETPDVAHRDGEHSGQFSCG